MLQITGRAETVLFRLRVAHLCSAAGGTDPTAVGSRKHRFERATTVKESAALTVERHIRVNVIAAAGAGLVSHDLGTHGSRRCSDSLGVHIRHGFPVLLLRLVALEEGLACFVCVSGRKSQRQWTENHQLPPQKTWTGSGVERRRETDGE